MPKRLLSASVTLLALLLVVGSQAQQTETFRDPNLQYHQAVELMEYGQYESARQMFGSYLTGKRIQNEEHFVNASYYHATCAMKLFHKDAKFLMQEFVLTFPESIWKGEAILALGRYSFNRRKYEDAIYFFNQLDMPGLDADTRDEVGFKTGFSAFETEDYDAAKASFYPLIEKDGPYVGPSNYYYGHVAYKEGNYQTALVSLKRSAKEEGFAPVVPYYITQILHFQEKYDELIDYAAPLVDSTGTKRREEIAHLVGNAYYQKQAYAEAVPYLEIFMEGNYNPEPQDAYQLAYAYYRTGAYEPSIGHFATASKAEDPALVQVATYQMADAYLQLGEKKYAQNAFRAASQMDQDREVTEDALFNYAKLAYELSFDPFHEAIQAFDRYLKAYPDSPRKDDAYAFLLRVHLATKNYPAAMSAIDQMQAKGLAERTDYQLAAYNHAVNLMREGHNESAVSFFNTALKNDEDPKIAALSHYWKGDLWYRMGDYEKAAASYNAFLNSPGSYGTPPYDNARYSIGYCHFKLNQYSASLESFRKFTASPQADKRRKHDAFLRIGDLYLVGKNYEKAIQSFEDALALNGAEGDYARFQIAMAYGYKDDHSRKAEELNKLFSDYPATSLAAVGRYQLGDSYFLTDQLDQSLAAFNTVINGHPDSPYRKKSLLRRGLVQYRKKAYDDAIASYKQVVKDYGVDAESKEAIAVLRSIYLDLGRIDEYSAWLADVPNYTVSAGEIDSLSYRAAENLVADGKCTEAIKALSDYLDKYPNGLFTVHARYYRADCAQRANDFALAVGDFEHVVERPTNQFTEAALMGAATIRYKQKDYEEALAHYIRLRSAASFAANVLEAEVGAMRSNFKLERFEEAMQRATAVLEQGNVPERLVEEARLTRGKSAFRLGNYTEATPDFAWLATHSKGAEGAEAKFLLADMAFRAGNLDSAEKEIFELIQGYASYDQWKVEGFLLLADVYIQREDYFQARATLQSILDNVEDPKVLDRAQSKMQDIADLEQDAKERGEARRKAEMEPDDDPYRDLIDEPISPEE